MNTNKLTWQQILEDVETLYNKIQATFVPKLIVGVARGGSIPATILSYKFNIPYRTIGIQSYTTNNTQSNINLYQDVSIRGINAEMSTLFVDDLADTGDTIRFIQDHYNLAKTATLYTKPKSLIKPDFSIKEYNDDQWLVFPWEE